MRPYENLLELHEKRIARAGKDLWHFITTMASEKISGSMAMKIKDHYGFRPSDVIFLCAMKGVEIEMEEFQVLLEKDLEYNKNIMLCSTNEMS